MEDFGKNFTIFLMDNGDPNGRWSCELANWSVDAYKIPRNMIKSCNDLSINNDCIYFLFGREVDSDKQTIYIGETEKGMQRVSAHIKEDYWNEAIIFSGSKIDKARVRYLEHEFYSIAKNVNRYKVMNGNKPQKKDASKPVIAEMDEFIYKAKLIVNILGHKVFESVKNIYNIAPGGVNQDDNTTLYLVPNKKSGAVAKGQVTSDGFVVFKGSSMQPNDAKSLSRGIINLRKRLIESSDVKETRFQNDVYFNSSSSAASCVLGTSISGPAAWKDKAGTSLKEIESGSKSNHQSVPALGNQDDKTTLYLVPNKKSGAVAKGQVTSDGFVVFKGSSMQPNDAKSLSRGIINLRKKLMESGEVKNNIFQNDVCFNSSSAAADCVLGVSISGPAAWKNIDGTTLKEIESGFDNNH